MREGGILTALTEIDSEGRLTEPETRRVARHGETEHLSHRKQAALQQLSAPVRSGYEAAFGAGRVPAIARLLCPTEAR